MVTMSAYSTEGGTSRLVEMGTGEPDTNTSVKYKLDMTEALLWYHCL